MRKERNEEKDEIKPRSEDKMKSNTDLKRKGKFLRIAQKKVRTVLDEVSDLGLQEPMIAQEVDERFWGFLGFKLNSFGKQKSGLEREPT
ncbi:hypothetical protein SLEP1_g57402 [Rubroshorea leprosula]|uniref:Uncharacterized protein n=1 Tax=Rubroshorea leprosula TaxID=152421 RepID=A0AAV5MLL1_9ROSI|nr:hypothetical protein SLEP1_g57402 [Rubroshorea leprosula]